MSFRADFAEVLIDRVAQARRPVTGSATSYEVLGPPHRFSPFLTLAEWRDRQRDGLPSQVVKLLVVLPEDESLPAWEAVLESERKRWDREMRRRLSFDDGVHSLDLPLSVRDTWQDEGLVRTATVGPIRRVDLLDESSYSVGADLEFTCLVRPHIPWPRLGDVGYSIEYLKQRWSDFCDRKELPAHLRANTGLFRHFCDEALIHGSQDLLLTSEWRFKVRSDDDDDS